MKFEPEMEHLKRWFSAERASGHGSDQCVKIAEIVIHGKKYRDEEKIEFMSRKATVLFNKARSDLSFSPNTALPELEDALSLNLICYARNFELGSVKLDKSEEYARNTAFVLFDFLTLHSRHDHFFKVILSLFERPGLKLDPIEDPIIRSLGFMARDRFTKGDSHKLRAKLENLARDASKTQYWHDKFASKRVVEKARQYCDAISQRTTGRIH